MERTGCSSLPYHMKACQLSYVMSHDLRLPDVKISKDILHGELISRSRPIGRLLLLFHDKVKRDIKQLHLTNNHQTNMYEIQVSNRQALKKNLNSVFSNGSRQLAGKEEKTKITPR